MNTELRKHIDAAVEAAAEAVGYSIPYDLVAKAIEAALPHLNEARMAARRTVGREQQPVLKTNAPTLTRQ